MKFSSNVLNFENLRCASSGPVVPGLKVLYILKTSVVHHPPCSEYICVKVVSIVSLWYVAIDQRLDIHFHFWKFSWKLATFSLPLHWEISFSSSFLSWNTIETRKMGQFESWLFQRNRLLEVCGGPRTLGPRTLGPPMLGPRTLSPGTLGPRMLGPLCH